MSNQFDVCVVGAGLAGATTAARAAELGLRVILIEKAPEDRYMCNSRMTSGVFHLAVHSVMEPPEALEQAVLKATSSANPAMAHVLATNSARAVRWLQSKGIRFIRGSAEAHHDFVVAPPATHRNGPFDVLGRGGDVMLDVLHKSITSNGAVFRRGCQGVSLEMENGRCRGVVVRMQGSEQGLIPAANVVIADGGFQTNLDLLKESGITPRPDLVVQRNARTGTGDGLKMAIAAGARPSNLLGFYGHLLSKFALSNEKLWPYPWLDLVATAGIAVDNRGRRFADESRGGIYLANKIAGLAEPSSAFAILDQLIWNGPGRTYMNPPNPRLLDVEGAVFKANSIPELAQKLGMPSESLKAEVDAYNAAIAQNKLGELSPPGNGGKVKAYPIAVGPFYGIQMAPGITYTMGGIAADEWSRAMRADGQVFLGLFAAGSASGGVEGGEGVGYVGGLVKAAVTGLRAAECIRESKV